MKGIKFPEANGSLARPEGTSKEDCTLLPVYRGSGLVVSAWKLTDEDLKRIFETKIVWFIVQGVTHAPLKLQTEDPFDEEVDHANTRRT